ncbi:MAG: GNAT family N-acetyltransferase [Gemmatimonadaceae bacterium]|nr:GNAT family N-acetyltransferase [Gemmatimonadaceae bacterium]
MLALRSQVFVVEQQCVYLDPDGLDRQAHHLFGWSASEPDTLVCGVRILGPGVAYAEPSIGRVVASPRFRGTGLGRVLMERALVECARLYPGQGIRIGAQHYLERFYAGLGFVTVSAPYDEDGILHVKMLLSNVTTQRGPTGAACDENDRR